MTAGLFQHIGTSYMLRIRHIDQHCGGVRIRGKQMKSLCGEALERQYVKTQFQKGKKVSEISLGETVLVHRYFFRTSYISYSNIARMYMQVAGGEFGEFPVDEYSLVVEDKYGKEHKLHIDRPEYIQEIMRWIKENHTEILIGKK